MTITSIIVGVLVLGALFGLMVWGQKYLGEEKGRNPRRENDEVEKDAIENPCRNCGVCKSKPSNASK
jgi:hypothetical protein